MRVIFLLQCMRSNGVRQALVKSLSFGAVPAARPRNLRPREAVSVLCDKVPIPHEQSESPLPGPHTLSDSVPDGFAVGAGIACGHVCKRQR